MLLLYSFDIIDLKSKRVGCRNPNLRAAMSGLWCINMSHCCIPPTYHVQEIVSSINLKFRRNIIQIGSSNIGYLIQYMLKGKSYRELIHSFGVSHYACVKTVIFNFRCKQMMNDCNS